MADPRFITAAEASNDNIEKINDTDGNLAIDIASAPSVGRTLYSNDGETQVMSWGNIDGPFVTINLATQFDFTGSISMVDPATFSISSDRATAKALVSVNLLSGDVLYLTPLASPPDGVFEGALYAGTDHHLYYYNGTTWKQLDN